MLDRIEPMRVGVWRLQKPVARPQRPLQGADAAGMAGIDRQHQAIEKATAFAGGAGEQGIHRRHHPDDAQMIREGGRRSDGLAVDAAAPRCRAVLAGRCLDAGPEGDETERALDLRRHRPGAAAAIVVVAAAMGDVVQRRPAQAAPGPEKRDRLDEVGLAGAVGADQHDGVTVERDTGGAIAAEVGQRQAADAGGGHGDVLLVPADLVAAVDACCRRRRYPARGRA